MDDQYLQQFSRHILLNEIGIEGQEKLKNSHVVIVGAGGLGSPVALYLTVSGIGRITIVDADTVDLTNLQRQVLHTQESIGHSKVSSAKSTLQRYSTHSAIDLIDHRLDASNITDMISSANLVIDCTDNFPTRYLINAECSKQRIPLLSGSAIRFSGQVALFDFAKPDSPCYQCIFPEGEDTEALRCSVTGVFSPLTGVVGTLLANEAMKFLGGFGENLSGQILTFDALKIQFKKITILRDNACSACAF